MHTTVKAILAAAAGVGLFAGAAFALHNEPGIAKTIKVSILTPYEPCTIPDTMTTTIPPVPACSTAVRSDSICGFVGGGHGKIQIKTENENGWLVKIKLLGLSEGCVDETIDFFATLRTTSHICGTPSPLLPACTAVDQVDTPLGSCTVNQFGVCVISTPNYVLPTILGNGGTEIADLRGMRGALKTFTWGIVSTPLN